MAGLIIYRWKQPGKTAPAQPMMMVVGDVVIAEYTGTSKESELIAIRGLG